MTLVQLNVAFKGASQDTMTSDNAAVSKAIVSLDTILTAAAREFYGNIVDAEIDVRRIEHSETFEVDYGYRLNIGMARRAALCGDSALMEPDPMVVVDALGLRAQDLGDPDASELEEGTVHGVFGLLLALSGRPIDRVYLTPDSVDVKSGKAMFHITMLAYRLLRDRSVRRGIADFVGALKSSDVTRIEILDRQTGNTILELDARHVVACALPPEVPVVLVDEVRSMALSLAAPYFRRETQWIFENGTQTIVAGMKDERFLKRVENGLISLRPGDVLIVNMHLVTEQTKRGLHSVYDVVRVVDFRQPGLHIPMPGV